MVMTILHWLWDNAAPAFLLAMIISRWHWKRLATRAVAALNVVNDALDQALKRTKAAAQTRKADHG